MKKVLIIEDIPIFQEFLVFIIRSILPGAEFVSVDNKDSAIEALEKYSFDLIILDGQLEPLGYPKSHGRQILPHLTDEQKRVTVVNSSDDDFMFEATDKGVKFFLCRKNDEDDLRLITQDLLS